MPKFADDGRSPAGNVTWVPYVIDADEIGGAPVDQNMTPAASDVLTWDGAEWVPGPVTGAGGAPANATYVTISTNATLTNERTLAVSSPATLSDGGAGNAVTIGVQTFGAAQAGAVPLSGGGTANYLRADGTWSAPPGTGVTSVGATAPITTTGGTTPTIGITAATTLAAGSMSASDKAKLDGLPSSAVPTTRTISTTAPLTGGGDLSADRTLAVSTFGSGASGVVPASGGGTSNFLRADGTWATPSGSGATYGSSTLNFGSAPGSSTATVIVTGQTGCISTSRVQAWIQGDSTATHNAFEHTFVPLTLRAGDVTTGGFTVYASSDLRLDGTFTVRWAWSN